MTEPLLFYFICNFPQRYKVDSQQKDRGNTYLKCDAVTDMTQFNLVLVHCADVGLHLYDASGRQGVFTLFLY